MRAAILIPLLLLGALPVASAVSVGQGVIFPWENTTLTTAQGFEFADPVTFTTSPPAIVLNGYSWHAGRFDNGSTDWYLQRYQPTANVTVNGTMATNGTMRFGGFTGTLYVSGVPNEPTFAISGPSAEWTIPAGEMTVTISSVPPSILGENLNITTAFDQWIPVLILGGAAILFAIAKMFFPVVACVISLVAQLFDPPVYGIAGAVMIIGSAIILQIMKYAFTDPD